MKKSDVIIVKKEQNKREKYHDKMIRLDFSKIHPYVHKDDKKQVLKDIEELRLKRMKQLD